MTWTARQLAEVRIKHRTITKSNQVNVFQGELQVLVNPWFTDADNAFLFSAPADNGLVLVEWQDVRRRAWVDEDTSTLKFKATYAGLVIPGGVDFRGAIGIQGA